MAIKFLAVASLAVLVIMTPIQIHYNTDVPTFPGRGDNKTHNETIYLRPDLTGAWDGEVLNSKPKKPDQPSANYPPGYFWMHAVFVYAFTALAMYLLNDQTKKIIRVRQEYLGRQSTVTDRTIRLSGIPPELRSEPRLKDFIEKLEIGKIESITLCRDWSELDQLMEARASTLRRLEEAWAVNLKPRGVERNLETLPFAQPAPPEPLPPQDSGDESSALLGDDEPDHPSTTPYMKQRPKTRIRYGFLNLRSKEVDAVDYYEEKLRQLDEKIKKVCQKEFKPAALAFVTMDSIAACVRELLELLSCRLIISANGRASDTGPFPIPVDCTCGPGASRYRMEEYIPVPRQEDDPGMAYHGFRWIVGHLLVGPVNTAHRTPRHQNDPKGLACLERGFGSAQVLEISGSDRLADVGHLSPERGRAVCLRLYVSCVWHNASLQLSDRFPGLSNMQGMISQAEVELSVISKNFFFTFFNLFLSLTVLGSAAHLLTALKGFLNRTDYIANQLAQQLEKFGQFYINLIILQGLGLFPFRLLEFGSVSLYPIYRMGAKTPRGRISFVLSLILTDI